MYDRKEIDRVEMLKLLGEIYAVTATGYARVSLRRMITSKAEVKSRYAELVTALIETKLLTAEGKTSGMAYKWNMKEYGPPSLVLVDLIIGEMRRVRCRRVKVYYHSKKRSQNQKEKANERNADDNRS